MALAVVSLGYSMEMFDEQVLNGTVLVILVTCALAPIITSRAAAKEKIRLMGEEQSGSGQSGSQAQRSVRTAVAVSNPLTIQGLVELAVLMNDPDSRSDVTAVHVRNDNTAKAKTLSRNALEEARKAAAAANESITGVERFDLNTVTGLANIVAERDIDRIIVGLHRRSTVIDSFLGVKIDQLLNSTNRMLVVARCYIPAGAVTRIVVSVPDQAQYETGFTGWVTAVANLTSQIGCRVIFCCSDDVRVAITSVLRAKGYGIRFEFRTVNDRDDFVILSRRILSDDLFIFVGARANSLSYNAHISEMPDFIDRHFSANNLLVIYPEQFGAEAVPISFTDPRSADITTAPSPVLNRLRRLLRRR